MRILRDGLLPFFDKWGMRYKLSGEMCCSWYYSEDKYFYLLVNSKRREITIFNVVEYGGSPEKVVISLPPLEDSVNSSANSSANSSEKIGDAVIREVIGVLPPSTECDEGVVRYLLSKVRDINNAPEFEKNRLILEAKMRGYFLFP